jgi:hypothetical protein
VRAAVGTGRVREREMWRGAAAAERGVCRRVVSWRAVDDVAVDLVVAVEERVWMMFVKVVVCVGEGRPRFWNDFMLVGFVL